MRKHFKYLDYVIRHKYFVFVAGLKTKAPLWRLLIHDWSKFMPSEWLPYTEFFYGDHHDFCYKCGEHVRRHDFLPCKYYRTKDAFDRAWLHHLHLNPHHWQHWVLRMDSGDTLVLNMPEKLIREMVADWMGAGRAITGRWEAYDWYQKNKDKMQMTEDTRSMVECLLEEVR
jgi:hypothetical protein